MMEKNMPHEISDDELDQVAGGCGGNKCPDCGKDLTIHTSGDGRSPDDDAYATCECGYDSRK